MTTPRILVTNDDGIDSVGLHVLARSLTHLGDVTIVAPDMEYSGASAAIGALHEMQPEAHEVEVDGIDTSWSVTGPPGLCVMFARLGAFGPLPDLIVSGINPGANVGRSVYHSGTVGAALTGRNGHIPGIAVSQSVSSFGVEGQAYDEMLAGQHWESAATIAATVVEAMLAEPPPDDAGVLNLNVPNLARRGDQAGWALDRWWAKARPAGDGHRRPGAQAGPRRAPTRSSLSWGDEQRPARPSTDTGSGPWIRPHLGHLAEPDHRPRPGHPPGVEAALDTAHPPRPPDLDR